VTLTRLAVQGFRNLATQQLVVPPGSVAVLGDNGAGKTNLLEAIAVLGNLSSFRPGSPTGWVGRNGSAYVLEGTVRRAGSEVTIRQTGRVAGTLQRSLYRGPRRLGSDQYLEIFPVVAISSADRLLLWGTPQDRRRFLDRVAFQLHPETLVVMQRYRRALKQRNALLQRGGSAAAFDAFESDLAVLGARLVHLRQSALDSLQQTMEEELTRVEWGLARPVLRYHAPDGVIGGEEAAVARGLREKLARLRRDEQARGVTTVGPHRHDLLIIVHSAPAREVLSAGQGKLLAVTLRLAAMTALARGRGEVPTVVFDDVDAELDGNVLERVLARFTGEHQVLLSSAHEEMLLPRLKAAAVWRVAGGHVECDARGSDR